MRSGNVSSSSESKSCCSTVENSSRTVVGNVLTMLASFFCNPMILLRDDFISVLLGLGFSFWDHILSSISSCISDSFNLVKYLATGCLNMEPPRDVQDKTPLWSLVISMFIKVVLQTGNQNKPSKSLSPFGTLQQDMISSKMCPVDILLIGFHVRFCRCNKLGVYHVQKTLQLLATVHHKIQLGL